MKRSVITGIGCITPAGIGVDALWERVLLGRACTQTIDRFDASRYLCQVAGQADDFRAEQVLPPRFIKRTDRFTHLALAAVQQALEDARLSIGTAGGVNPERVGVTVGNILGGWEFAERELRKLWRDGEKEVSPYQATAWFPTAPQGAICIAQGIKGPARTFISDRASGAYALIHGAGLIRRGQVDVVIAGGVEAPLSPYGWLCCQTSGFLTRHGNTSPMTAYRPFDKRHSGSVLGEGSAFLILEELEHAQQRGATIYGELRGWAVGSDGYMPYYTVEPHGTILTKTMRTCLQHASLVAEDIDVIFAHGTGVPAEDVTEVYAIKEVFGKQRRQVAVTAPKSAIGHLLGAATPVDVAIAVYTMVRKEIPPTANLDEPAPGFDLDFVQHRPRKVAACHHSLVVSRGLGGVNACLVVSA
ncbi:MAG TPA: beta-ketoacyl-[acyl-carrier-protein] synthase family protein [Ktedonobacteraceae bacterium]|nr:beta-ketoacyl-[acyl-carrier-protein] synthase family protein [Ktedonobacteraceae bacterium]